MLVLSYTLLTTPPILSPLRPLPSILSPPSSPLPLSSPQHPESFSFYGLGWDVDKDYFKVYIMFHQVTNLPHRYLKLVSDVLAESKMPPIDEIKWAPFGLISFTYKRADDRKAADCEAAAAGSAGGSAEDPRDPATGEAAGDVAGEAGDSGSGSGGTTCQWKHLSKLHEEKVYLYPDGEVIVPGIPKPEGTAGTALMFATKRRLVPQYDLQSDSMVETSGRQARQSSQK